jgi:hypothetical protein
MPQPWVSGPVTALVAGQELGTAERYPRFLLRSGWLPYFNDISGPVIPNDMLWAGKEVFVFMDLNRWDQDVLDGFRTITAKSPDPLNWPKNAVGTLMIHEEEAVIFTLLFPYADKEKYAGMPKGYFFNACWMEAPEEFGVLGTNPQKFHLVVHGLAVDDGDNWSLGKEV